MKRRTLGRTGLSVPEIGFGCGTTADLMIHGSAAERREAVRLALELGIDYFDTAPVYGDTVSEANLGQALRELQVRPIIATKVALEERDFGDIAGAVVRSVEASVARLGMPVTLIQLHNRVGPQRAARAEFGSGALLEPGDVLGPGGVVQAFGSLRARGLVRFFGCSSYGGDMALVRQLVDSGSFDALIVSYSMLNASAWPGAPLAEGMRDYASVGAHAGAAGLGVIALRVLEAGVLTDSPPAADPAIKPEQAAMLAQALPLRQAACAAGQPLAQRALRWALANAQVSLALVGFSSLAQIRQACLWAGDRWEYPGP